MTRGGQEAVLRCGFKEARDFEEKYADLLALEAGG
jgi:hypothetical protein